jgi:PiT family inorganic phosphate transporter
VGNLPGGSAYPTSESHALIAGISGAAVAIQNGFSGINGSEWIKVIYGLLLSSVLGFFLGYGTSKLVKFLFRKWNAARRTAF